ncbi:hypothetical protein A7M48_19995 [Acinetobacter baumannii]|nr:hypothetical protein A7M48_19995 [Acinetobacter baumannii]
MRAQAPVLCLATHTPTATSKTVAVDAGNFLAAVSNWKNPTAPLLAWPGQSSWTGKRCDESSWKKEAWIISSYTACLLKCISRQTGTGALKIRHYSPNSSKNNSIGSRRPAAALAHPMRQQYLRRGQQHAASKRPAWW